MTYRHTAAFPPSPHQTSPEAGHALGKRPLLGYRILAVDDAHVMRVMLQRVLMRAGFLVEVAEDGAAAIDQALSFRPHLVLMDLTMPVMDGWEATRRLRTHPKLSGTRVVALSCNAQDADVRRAFACGAHSYLTKPVAHEQLVAHLHEVLTAPAPAQKTSLTDCCILVVDDAGMIRRKVVRALADLGCRIIEAVDGGQAVHYALTYRPDLILMDVNAPMLDGGDVARRIRRQPSLQHVPIIALAAGNLQSDVEQVLHAGVTDYLVKPVADERLLQRVAQYLVDRVLDARNTPAPVVPRRAAVPA